MTTGRAVSAVVVAYGGVGDLRTCLDRLGRSVPVVVVDNSSDPAVAAVADGCAAVYVDTGSNLGFAAGVNIGLAHLPADHDVLLLNPDATIDPDQVRLLHTALLADAGLAAVTPVLLDDDGVRQREAWPFPTPARMWAESLLPARFRPHPDDYVVGAVLLLRREAVDDVGGFDERFFLYAEETDWQRRAVSCGWRSAVVEGTTATHRGAGTSTHAQTREQLFHAAAETYVRKWHGRTGWAAYRTATMTGAAVRAVLARAPERRAAARQRAGAYARGPRRVAGLS